MPKKGLFVENPVKRDAQTGILVGKDSHMIEHALKRRLLIHPASCGMAPRSSYPFENLRMAWIILLVFQYSVVFKSWFLAS